MPTSGFLGQRRPPLEAFHHSAAGVEVETCLIARWYALERVCQPRGSASSSSSVESERLPVDVVQVITRLMVASVIRRAGASVQRSGRDAELDEPDEV